MECRLESRPGEWVVSQELDIVEVPGEGRTLRVRGRVAAGAELWRERVCAAAESEEELLDILVQGLRREGKDAFWPAGPSGTADEVAAYKAQAEAGDFQPLAQGIFASSYQFGRHALLRVLALVNHACSGSKEANACMAFCTGCHRAVETGRVLHAIASREIQPGELIRWPYARFFDTAHRQKISATHGFVCQCSVCSEPPEAVLRMTNMYEAACTAPGCAQVNAKLRCGRCKATYCSSDCQRADYRAHKPICKTQSAGERETADAYLARCSRSVDDLEMSQYDPDLENRMANANSSMERLEVEASHFRQVAESAVELTTTLRSGGMRLDDHHALVYRTRRRIAFATLRVLLAEKDQLELAEREPGYKVTRSVSLARKALEAVRANLAVAATVLPRFDPEFCDLWNTFKQLLETSPQEALAQGVARYFLTWQDEHQDVLKALLVTPDGV